MGGGADFWERNIPGGGSSLSTGRARSRGRSGRRAFDLTLPLLFFRDGPLRGVAQRTDVVGLRVSEGPPGCCVERLWGWGAQKQEGLVGSCSNPERRWSLAQNSVSIL